MRGSDVVRSEEPDPRDSFRQLGKLRAGLAFKTLQEKRDPVTAGLLYLQAAQAFERGGDAEEARNAAAAGVFTARHLRATWPHPEGAVAMTFLPGDRQVLTVGVDGDVHVWDAAMGREARSFRIEEKRSEDGDRILGAAFGKDRSRLLVWGVSSVQLWSATDGTLVHKWDKFPSPRGAVFLLDDRRVLIFGRGEGELILWDLEKNREAGEITKGSPDEETVSISPNRRRFSTVGIRGVYLWDALEGKLLRLFPSEEAKPGFGTSRRVAFSPDGKRLLIVPFLDDSARLFEADTGRLLVKLDKAGTHGVEFSPDGTKLLAWADQGQVQLWDLATGKLLKQFEGSGPAGAHFGRDGTHVLTLGEPARVWHLTGAGGVNLGAATGGTFTRDGNREILWGGKGRCAQVWEDFHHRPLLSAAAVVGPRAERPRGCLSSHGKHLLSWDMDYTARWWDLSHGKAQHKFEHRRDLFGAKLDVKGTRALTWGLDGEAKVWDLGTGKLVRALVHDRPVSGAAFAPEGEHVWTWTAEGFFEWDLKTGQRLRHLKPRFRDYADKSVRLEGVVTAELSRDGRRFVLADAGGWVRWWDIATKQELPSPGRNPYTGGTRPAAAGTTGI
jgi:WD40 repeat protein